jgi:butyryl-CoA dehydrogenase
MDLLPDNVLSLIKSRATDRDMSGDWPDEELRDLWMNGAARWAVPTDCGGLGLSPIELHLLYERLTVASLAVALVVTQRDSAVGFLDGLDPAHPRRTELLTKLARHETFATIGIAQLTTSRQAGAPALRARRVIGGYALDGLIPWSTGAGKADFVIAGATLDDGQQILFALPRGTPGVEIAPPMPLVALGASWTTSITCRDAIVADTDILRGPAERALAGRAKSLPIGPAFLATGLCRAALDLIAGHDSDAGRSAHARFSAELERVRNDVLTICDPNSTRPDVTSDVTRVRSEVNELALRVTHAAVTLYKGTALLTGHPAQRLAREAMFLLVWSCPNPVIECTVDRLAGR